MIKNSATPAWDTTIKPEPKRQLVVDFGSSSGDYSTAYIVEDGKIVTRGFTCDGERMNTLQIGFVVDALARSETRKE